MTTPSTLFAQLQLAEASYSELALEVYEDPEALKTRLTNKKDFKGEFSNAQADEFIKC